mmetsp:Transcript_16588/g.19672  ORF Transcript_16588/g.19672 Transcript_16588/m.19672 type:complete len:309 (-) Transcript_16588:578-1504(-)
MKAYIGPLLFLLLDINNPQLAASFQFQPVLKLRQGITPPSLPVRSGENPPNALEQRCQNNRLYRRTIQSTSNNESSTQRRVQQLSATTDKSNGGDNATDNDNKDKNVVERKWSHSDLEWRLRPSPEMSRWRRVLVRIASKALRLEFRLLRKPVPPILCPKGESAVLEAYKNRKKIARFGITTTRGPPEPIITQSIEQLYNITVPWNGAGIAAIIYMFVEPDYRNVGIGDLALEAISAIHTVQNCDFTVLVADDDGSGKLVRWYERNGFLAAPDLQDLFGSPGGKFGVTMMKPVQMTPDFFERCTVKWW